jgi:excisionase family DNA binding protein
MENIYTLEEVSKHLKVPVEAIEQEIEEGNLQALDVAGHVRISEFALSEYKKAITTKPRQKIGSKTAQPKPDSSWLSLQPTASFVHRWPDNKIEEYRNALEGVATTDGRQYNLKLGWTTRKSGGEERRRWLILVDRYPTVEFVMCTDKKSDGTELVASIIRDRKGKQIPALATVPAEYKDFSVAVYSEKVKGPGTSNGQAVVCSVDDFEAMVRHALIRTRYREERK